jgi:hypothetical protein
MEQQTQVQPQLFDEAALSLQMSAMSLQYVPQLDENVCQIPLPESDDEGDGECMFSGYQQQYTEKEIRAMEELQQRCEQERVRVSPTQVRRRILYKTPTKVRDGASCCKEMNQKIREKLIPALPVMEAIADMQILSEQRKQLCQDDNPIKFQRF